jgi:hypothetical protein
MLHRNPSAPTEPSLAFQAVPGLLPRVAPQAKLGMLFVVIHTHAGARS